MTAFRYEARIRVDEISAGHWLPDYPGACSQPHGHNWSFEVVIGAQALHQEMIVDFRLVKEFFKRYDHLMFNDIPALVAGGRQPTTERIAEFTADQIQTELDRLPNRPQVVELTVIETSRNQVTYRPWAGAESGSGAGAGAGA